MILNFVPRLEYMATIKIVTFLSNRDDFRTSLANFPFLWAEFRKKDWNEIENKMKEEISKLELPTVLKQRAKHLVKPILREIVKWRNFYQDNCKLGQSLPNETCWTPHGAIDQKRTAELLIKDCNLSVFDRYQLACFFCLETEIKALWEKLPEEYKIQIYAPGFSLNGSGYTNLCFLWTCVMKGKMDISPFQKAFLEALKCYNLPAAECFFQKLTPSERKEVMNDERVNHVIENCSSGKVTGKPDTEFIYFFITQMDEERRTQMFERYGFNVIHSFLVWPWQGLFMEVVNCIWNHVSEFCYCFLLIEIVLFLEQGINDYNYREMLMQFWLQSPETHKQYVLSNNPVCMALLGPLFILDDGKESIRLVLKDATVDSLEKMISFCDGATNDGPSRNQRYCKLDMKQWLEFCEFLKLIYEKRMENDHNHQSKKIRLEVDC